MTEAVAPLPIHRLHDEDVERLLARGERRHELVALFGEQGYRELSTLARRAARRRAVGGPRVYVLPGLMGSRIGSPGVLLDDVLWVDLLEIAAGHLTRLALPGGRRLVALGAILLNALKLKLSLRIAGFDVHLHAYDWRRSVAELAAELDARVVREVATQPVMLVGHSMGGVVARLALARQTSGRITRVVQLGAPNHGSFAPVLALRGVYPTVRKLAALDRRHGAEDLARLIFRTLPALHELLPDPARAGGFDLFATDAWPADALRPERSMLEEAQRQRASWPEADDRCLHVAGVRQDTVDGLVLREREFEFSLAPVGDGTVPLRLAVMPGQPAWYVGEMHGGLPNNGRVIGAVVDLLRTGTTDRLPQTTTRARSRPSRPLSEAALRRVAPHKVHWTHLSPDARRRLLEPVVSPEFHGAVIPAALERAHAARLASLGPAAAPPPPRVLELRLAHYSIVDANARALVLGVFRHVDPAGPAAAIDAVLGGAIREFTLRRMFAGRLGQVFVLPAPRNALLAELVLFAGLGDFDDFGGDAQSFVAENVVRTFAKAQVEDFATVLFGAGSGLPVAAAVEQQLRGFVAGLRVADPDAVVRRITLCETDKRKYAALVRAAHKVAPALGDEGFAIRVDESSAAPPSPGVRAPRRPAAPPVRHRDPAYLLVTTEAQGRATFAARASLLTAGAKAAVLTGTTTVRRAALERLVAPLEEGSATSRDLARIGSGLASLLLAPSVREGLATVQARPLVVVHDREGSRVPWEVLRIGGVHPALGAGLTRRYASEALTVARWREERGSSDPLRMLLVVDPSGDLPGAADEGESLRTLLQGRSVRLDVLHGAEATCARIVAALAAGTYDVLHFAGHAAFDPADPGRGGLVCAGGELLRGADLEGLAHLPALIFCNACEAARVRRPRRGAGRASSPRRRFALSRSMTGVAEALLAGGVANFLGTHWPVGDEAAFAFSQQLYESMLDGAVLGAAVLAARQRVAAIPSLDWADYVHYGNAEFRLALP